MKLALDFFRVQLKKMWKLFPYVFCVTIVTCLCVGALGWFYMKSNREGEQKIYGVAVVGNLEDSYLGFGLQAIRTLDDSKYVIDFQPMNEEEAKAAFLADRVVGILFIPDGLVDSFVYGRNDVRIRYVVSDGQKGLTNILMEEFAKIASALIIHSQAGVFAMQEVLWQEGNREQLDAATVDLNLKYINMVLSRTDLCDVKELGISNGLSIAGYLGCGLVLFLFVIMGITYGPGFSGRKVSLMRIYKAKGLSVPVQTAGEYLTYFLSVFSCTAGIAVLVSVGLLLLKAFPDSRTEDSYLFAEIVEELSAGELFGSFLKMIPVLLMITAMQFLFYELVSGVVSSVLIQFILGLGMCYLSGCFYPAGFFPAGVRLAGELLPTGFALKYMAGSILEEISAAAILGMLVYFGIFAALACLARSKKIRRG